MGKETGHYYLHTNGSLIHKPAIVVDSDPNYFDSDFVKRFWKFDSSNREDAWIIVLESLALGVNHKQVKELVDKWGLTIKDSLKLMKITRPSKDTAEGLKIFITEILNMSIEDYWSKIEKLLEE